MHAYLRHWMGMFRGGATPRDAALAVAFGLLAGFLTGWNYSVAVVLGLALLFNVNTLALIVAWCAGAGLAWLAQGVTWHIGHVLLDQTACGRLVAALGDGPVVALLGWDQYSLVGGFVLAIVLALPFGHTAARVAEQMAGGAGPTTGRLLRPWGWLVASGMAAVLAALPGWIAPDVVGAELLDKLSRFSGAEASLGDLQLSLWTGEARIDDLRLADPRQPQTDRLRVERIRARVRPGELVRGRLHIEHLVCEGIYTAGNQRVATEATSSEHGWLEASVDPAAAVQVPPHVLVLNDTLCGGDQLAERLRWLPELINAVERLAEVESEQTSNRWRQRLLVAAQDRPVRSNLGREQPLLSARKLRIEQLPDAWGLGRRAVVELAHLSSDGHQSYQPRLEVLAPEYAGRMTVDLVRSGGEPRYPVRIEAADLRVGELVDQAGVRDFLAVKRGNVNLDGKGWLSPERLELALSLELRDLEAHFHGQQLLVGLSPELWNKGTRRLNPIRLDVALAGSWNAPLVVVDKPRLLAQYKHQLRAAGEHLLVQSVDEYETVLAASAAVWKSPEPGPPPPVATVPEPSHDARTTVARSAVRPGVHGGSVPVLEVDANALPVVTSATQTATHKPSAPVATTPPVAAQTTVPVVSAAQPTPEQTPTNVQIVKSAPAEPATVAESLANDDAQLAASSALSDPAPPPPDDLPSDRRSASAPRAAAAPSTSVPANPAPIADLTPPTRDGRPTVMAPSDANRWHQLPTPEGRPGPINMTVGLDEPRPDAARPTYLPPSHHPYVAGAPQVAERGPAPTEALPHHALLDQQVATRDESGFARLRRGVSNLFATRPARPSMPPPPTDERWTEPSYTARPAHPTVLQAERPTPAPEAAPPSPNPERDAWYKRMWR